MVEKIAIMTAFARVYPSPSCSLHFSSKPQTPVALAVIRLWTATATVHRFMSSTPNKKFVTRLTRTSLSAHDNIRRAEIPLSGHDPHRKA